MIRARPEGCMGHRRGVLGEAFWTRLSLPVSRCDPGSTSQNYISYPLSPFIKLHCKLCWPYRFFRFYCKAPLFFPRCSAVKLKNVLTTKSCCGLGKSYQRVANVSSRSPNSSFWLSRPIRFALSLCLSPATSPTTYHPTPFSQPHIFLQFFKFTFL